MVFPSLSGGSDSGTVLRRAMRRGYPGRLPKHDELGASYQMASSTSQSEDQTESPCVPVGSWGIARFVVHSSDLRTVLSRVFIKRGRPPDHK